MSLVVQSWVHVELSPGNITLQRPEEGLGKLVGAHVFMYIDVHSASVVADMLGHAEVTGGGCIQQQGQGMGLSSDASPLEISALPSFIPGCCILHVAQRGAGLLHAAQRWKHFRAQEIAMAEEQEEEEAQGHGEAWKPWFVLYLFGFIW